MLQTAIATRNYVKKKKKEGDMLVYKFSLKKRITFTELDFLFVIFIRHFPRSHAFNYSLGFFQI